MAKQTVLAKGPTFKLVSKVIGRSGKRGDFVLTLIENGKPREIVGYDFAEACMAISEHLNPIGA